MPLPGRKKTKFIISLLRKNLPRGSPKTVILPALGPTPGRAWPSPTEKA